MKIVKTLVFASVIGLTATPALAGSFGEAEINSDLTWRADCTAPARPAVFIDDIDSYNQALEQFNAYVAQVRVFIQCIQSDGKADIDALAAAVARGMQEQQKSALDDVEDLRTDLNVQRTLLR